MWIRVLENYEVSDTGLIRNAKTGRLLKQHIGNDGYLRTQVDGKTRLVHRLIACAFVPANPGKDFVNHIDGNKQNNCVSNLEWVTQSENMKHAYKIGLKKPLARTENGHAKLSEEEVAFIRENYVAGDRKNGAKALGMKFGVAHQTIAAVYHGQNWKG